MSELVKKPVVYDAKQGVLIYGKSKTSRALYYNVGYPGDVQKILESRGLKVPKNRLTQRKTTGEDALNAIYAETGDEICKEILYARELSKIKGTYVNVKLANGVYYTSYIVTGTVTGRRSSKKTALGFGGNHQNIPKHSELGKKFRECLIARPGKIFLNCDQAQAEDWPVNAIIAAFTGDFSGLNELRAGVDRHRKLASLLFSKPEVECGKDTAERFMGKKTRHAGNYDMEAPEFSRQMIKEGHSFPISLCAHFLKIFHANNPGIKNGFHKHVRDTIMQTRKLVTPFARERYFLNIRPFSENKKEFKEAYSYLPQSTVGDNNGFAILFCETNEPGYVIMDGHDATVLEVNDDLESIKNGVALLTEAYNREITIGDVTFKIPIEFDLGYDLKNMLEFKKPEDIESVYAKLHQLN